MAIASQLAGFSTGVARTISTRGRKRSLSNPGGGGAPPPLPPLGLYTADQGSESPGDGALTDRTRVTIEEIPSGMPAASALAPGFRADDTGGDASGQAVPLDAAETPKASRREGGGEKSGESGKGFLSKSFSFGGKKKKKDKKKSKKAAAVYPRTLAGEEQSQLLRKFEAKLVAERPKWAARLKIPSKLATDAVFLQLTQHVRSASNDPFKSDSVRSALFEKLLKHVDAVYSPNVQMKRWAAHYWHRRLFDNWHSWYEEERGYRRAVQIQSAARQRAARAVAARVRHSAEDEAFEYYRQALRQRKAARAAKAAIKEATTNMATWIVKEAINSSRMPYAAVSLQRVVRGKLARSAVERRRHALGVARKRARIAARWREAMSQVYELAADRGKAGEIAARRQWARTKWSARGGWKPNHRAREAYELMEYVDAPPAGEEYGLRTPKVKLPASDPEQTAAVAGDKNTWFGVPVQIREYHHEAAVLGPPARRVVPGAKRRRGSPGKTDSGRGSTGAASSPTRHFTVQHTWLPTSVVTDKAVLLAAGPSESEVGHSATTLGRSGAID